MLLCLYIMEELVQNTIIIKERMICMKVQDCMCDKAICVKPETNIHDVAKLMGDNHIGCVPVCEDGGKIVGILTDRDIILRGIACEKDAKTTPVSDIMTTKVIRTSPDADIKDVAYVMAENQVRRIPIVMDEKVVGIISLGNLAQTPAIHSEKLGDTLEYICNNKGDSIKNNK